MTRRGTKQAEFASKAHGLLQGRQPTREPAGSQADQQVKGDVKDLLACLPGNLHLERVIHADPGITQHHRWTCTTAAFALHT